MPACFDELLTVPRGGRGGFAVALHGSLFQDHYRAQGRLGCV